MKIKTAFWEKYTDHTNAETAYIQHTRFINVLSTIFLLSIFTDIGRGGTVLPLMYFAAFFLLYFLYIKSYNNYYTGKQDGQKGANTNTGTDKKT